MKQKSFAVHRMAAVQDLLKEKELKAVLLLNPSRDNMNRWILASDNPPANPPFNRNAMYLISVDGNVTPFCACRPHPTDHDQYPLISSADITPWIASGKLGVTNPDCLKAVVWDALTEQAPHLELVDLTRPLLELRAEKTEAEVQALARSVHQYDRLFAAMPLMLRGGRTEHEIAVDIRLRLAQLGVDSEDWGTVSEVTMTSSPDGGNAETEPLLYPGRRLQWHDRVNVQVSGFLPDGGSAAMGRSYTLGPASEEAMHAWSLAVDAQHLAASLARPGATLEAIAEQVSREIFLPNDLPTDPSCWIYGIGCSRYESPRLSDETRTLPLKTGMTLAIGPNILLPDKDPYCCLDVYVVTEDGGLRLNRLSQELTEL